MKRRKRTEGEVERLGIKLGIKNLDIYKEQAVC